MDDLTKSKSADGHRNERVLLEPLRVEMAILQHTRRTRRLGLLGQDAVEQIRHREVIRALRKMNLSPKEEKIIERLSYTLVAELLLGPVSEVMARAEIQLFHRGRTVDRTMSKSKMHPEKSCTRNEQVI